MEGLTTIRRRRISSINLESPKKKEKMKKEKEKKEKNEAKTTKGWRSEMTPSFKIKIRSPDSGSGKKPESILEDGPPLLIPEVSRPLNPSGDHCPRLDKLELPGTSGPSRLRDEDEDSAFESNGRNEDDFDDDLESEDAKVNIF